jgi:hypothetical protein
MIVPRKISSVRLEVDVFVNAGKKGKLHGKDVQKVVHDLFENRVAGDWKGLRLDTVGRPTAAVPPEKSLVRGSIEDILGVPMES